MPLTSHPLPAVNFLAKRNWDPRLVCFPCCCSDLEAAKIKRLRDEEEQERLEKEKRRKTHSQASSSGAGTLVPVSQDAQHSQQQQQQKQDQYRNLPKEEVIRRLRVLGHPATLFGEQDAERLQRLIKTEQEMKMEDETVGGNLNALLALQRQERLAKKQAAAADKQKDRGGKGAGGGSDGTQHGDAAAAQKAAAAAAEEEADPTLAAFKRAAAQLAEKCAEEALPLEDRLLKILRTWCKEWEADLDSRPDEVKDTGSGVQVRAQGRVGAWGPRVSGVQVRWRAGVGGWGKWSAGVLGLVSAECRCLGRQGWGAGVSGVLVRWHSVRLLILLGVAACRELAAGYSMTGPRLQFTNAVVPLNDAVACRCAGKACVGTTAIQTCVSGCRNRRPR